MTDPQGDVVVLHDSREPGVVLAELDLSRMPTKMFDARRPEIYGPLTEPKRQASGP